MSICCLFLILLSNYFSAKKLKQLIKENLQSPLKSFNQPFDLIGRTPYHKIVYVSFDLEFEYNYLFS